MRRSFPWLIAVLGLVAAIASWRRAQRVSRPVDPATVGAGRPNPTGSDEPGARLALTLLQACRGRLKVAEVLLARCEQPAPSASPELQDPGVRAVVEQAVRRELAFHVEREQALRESEREALAASHRVLLQDFLGLAPEEAQVVRAYVCTAREHRRSLLMGMKIEELRAAALDALREDREVSLRDLEDQIGHERYMRLRSIGGLSLLSESLDCQ